MMGDLGGRQRPRGHGPAAGVLCPRRRGGGDVLGLRFVAGPRGPDGPGGGGLRAGGAWESATGLRPWRRARLGLPVPPGPLVSPQPPAGGSGLLRQRAPPATGPNRPVVSSRRELVGHPDPRDWTKGWETPVRRACSRRPPETARHRDSLPRQVFSCGHGSFQADPSADGSNRPRSPGDQLIHAVGWG